MRGDPRRVLQVVPSMGFSGIATMVMGLYRAVDRSRLQFDFIAFLTGHHCEEVRAEGGRVFYFDLIKHQGPWSYMANVARTIRAHGPYEAVHAHRACHDGLTLLAARRAGVRRRIAHVHTSGLESRRHRLVFPAMRWLLESNATARLACSEAAGRFMFGRRRFEVLPNAVDTARFQALTEEDRARARADLGLSPGSLLIGHVGRFSAVKNHAFLLAILSHLQGEGTAFTALLVGDGPLRPEIECRAGGLGLRERIAFLGLRADVPELMLACDVLLLPSHFEGLPLTVLEAQAAGTPCLVSTAVPASADAGLGLVRFLELSAGAKVWSEELRQLARGKRACRAAAADALGRAGYGMQASAERLMRLYGVT